MELSMSTCPHCNQTYNSIGPHLARCKPYIFLKLELEENLYNLYIIKKMSAIDISEKYNISLGAIYKMLKNQNIKKDWSQSAKDSARKREETNLRKTGVRHNFCKNSKSRQKWEKRLLEEEGITNVFQRESVKQKATETMIKKYKKENPGKMTTHRGKNVYSSIHRKIVKFLQKNNVNLSIEYKIKKEDIGYYSYDIIINNTNKLIEVYGDYWHGNPKIYKNNDILLKNTSREMLVSDKHDFDKKKNNYALSNNYELMIIWEYDINNNWDKIKTNLLEYCNK